MRLPDEPILAAAVEDPRLPPGCVAEPKWDGWRAMLRVAGGRVRLRSRRGSDLTRAFPELVEAASTAPDMILDGEVVIWSGGRLAFDRLAGRLGASAATAGRLAAADPASYVAFDLLFLDGEDFLNHSYTLRRAALEQVFTRSVLVPPFNLCPATDDPQTVREWLEVWPSLGIEGLVFKQGTSPYRPGTRGWRKYRIRSSTEAIVGAVTGRIDQPSSVLLGRLDADGRLRYAGGTVALDTQAAGTLARLLSAADERHPWQGRGFTAAWGGHLAATPVLVDPVLVVEVSADVALDPPGRWRHPVRYVRPRPDLAPADAPGFGLGNRPAAG